MCPLHAIHIIIIVTIFIISSTWVSLLDVYTKVVHPESLETYH